MRKASFLILCLFLAAIIAGCGQSDLPQNARDWLKEYEEMGNKSVDIARRAKELDLKDAAAVKAHNEAGQAFIDEMQTIMDDGQKIGDSLSPKLKKSFYDEVDKIKTRIEDEREKIKSGE